MTGDKPEEQEIPVSETCIDCGDKVHDTGYRDIYGERILLSDRGTAHVLSAHRETPVIAKAHRAERDVDVNETASNIRQAVPA